MRSGAGRAAGGVPLRTRLQLGASSKGAAGGAGSRACPAHTRGARQRRLLPDTQAARPKTPLATPAPAERLSPPRGEAREPPPARSMRSGVRRRCMPGVAAAGGLGRRGSAVIGQPPSASPLLLAALPAKLGGRRGGTSGAGRCRLKSARMRDRLGTFQKSRHRRWARQRRGVRDRPLLRGRPPPW